jgi:hypothetical protein
MLLRVDWGGIFAKNKFQSSGSCFTGIRNKEHVAKHMGWLGKTQY